MKPIKCSSLLLGSSHHRHNKQTIFNTHQQTRVTHLFPFRIGGRARVFCSAAAIIDTNNKQFSTHQHIKLTSSFKYSRIGGRARVFCTAAAIIDTNNNQFSTHQHIKLTSSPLNIRESEGEHGSSAQLQPSSQAQACQS